MAPWWQETTNTGRFARAIPAAEEDCAGPPGAPAGTAASRPSVSREVPFALHSGRDRRSVRGAVEHGRAGSGVFGSGRLRSCSHLVSSEAGPMGERGRVSGTALWASPGGRGGMRSGRRVVGCSRCRAGGGRGLDLLLSGGRRRRRMRVVGERRGAGREEGDPSRGTRRPGRPSMTLGRGAARPGGARGGGGHPAVIERPISREGWAQRGPGASGAGRARQGR